MLHSEPPWLSIMTISGWFLNTLIGQCYGPIGVLENPISETVVDMEAAQEGIKMAFTHFLDNRKSALEQLHENALDYWKPLYDALHFERIYTGKS